jgi:hypothetical protein
MKGIAGYVVGAILLVVLGSICLGASRLDGLMVNAQQSVLTSDYGAADASLQSAERYYGYASRLPWVGEGPANEVRARRAAVNYWQRKYGALAPADRTDPVADVAPENLALQTIVADSVYRGGQTRAKDRATMLEMLDSSIAAYQAVLRNVRRPEDALYGERAAYNYEYAVRLRNEIANGRRRQLPPPADDQTFGSEGKSENPEFEKQFKQYVPLEKDERQNESPGKFEAPVRKG